MKTAAVESLDNGRQLTCNKLFDEIGLNLNHRLAHLLPNKIDISYYLRRHRTFNTVKCKTDRFQNTFVLFAERNFNNTKSQHWLF